MKEIALLSKQEQCLASKARELLLSGGFRSGKTLSLIIKVITQHLTVPNNRGILGRLTYPELRDTLQKDFFNLLPEEWIAPNGWRSSDGNLMLRNGTEVLFRHMDTMSELEMRGGEYGFGLFSQVEEMEESVIDAFTGRLSLKHVPCPQVMMDCNPALFWAYKRFKQEKDSSRELIEFSMLDNQKNLREDYLANELKKPDSYKRQFVYGIWDESLLSNRAVIPIEYIQAQRVFETPPIRMFNGIEIFKDSERFHDYQIGVDTSEGIGLDFSAVSCVDVYTGEQVAFWKGQIQPDQLKTLVVPLAHYFNDAKIVPEINNTGIAFVANLKIDYPNIYVRKDFDREDGHEKQVYGWKTTSGTKPLLVDNFLTLLREGQAIIRSQKVINEMPTFIYTDDVKKKGMGAQGSFHDDGLIATMLSYLDVDPSKFASQVKKAKRIEHYKKANERIDEELSIVNM